jgi:hypothetical protein
MCVCPDVSVVIMLHQMLVATCTHVKGLHTRCAVAGLWFVPLVLLLMLINLLVYPLCWLQDVDKLRHAVGLKAYSSQQPLEEFRLEANRAFLVLLDSYRDAVVARLMVPDLNFSLLLDQQQEGLGDEDLQEAVQQPGAAAASVNGAANGRRAGSNGHQPHGGDMLQPAGAANQRRMA